MIFQKLKKLLEEFRDRTERLYKQDQQILDLELELEWSNIFHDTIADKPWLTTLSISPGRWAANYSLLYILTRILNDYKPKTIIEFGLGESSKVIDLFIKNIITDGKHLILEHDKNWTSHFKSRYQFQAHNQIIELELNKHSVKGFSTNSYNDIRAVIENDADLYLVDGPLGSDRYSRYDIFLLAEKFTNASEFIIIIDDYNRAGEKDTVFDLLQLFKEKQLKVYTGEYKGNKSQILIATEMYKYSVSM